MDKDLAREHLVQADRHIIDLRRHIALQRQRIKQLNQKGSPTNDAESMLTLLEESLVIARRHRDFIHDELFGNLTTR
jgi:hypothetical protein